MSKKKPCRNPCPECPWKKDSAPGYFGGTDMYFYADALQTDARVICHTIHGTMNQETVEQEEINESNMCAGYVIARNNNMKMPRVDPILRNMQEEYRDHPEKDSVFKWRHEFLEHHEAQFEEYIESMKGECAS